MTFTVTIAAFGGPENTYLCGGPNGQVALIYAGKVVEANADRFEPGASVTFEQDGQPFGPRATVRDMITSVAIAGRQQDPVR